MDMRNMNNKKIVNSNYKKIVNGKIMDDKTKYIE